MSQVLQSVAVFVFFSSVGYSQTSAPQIPAIAQNGEPRTDQGSSSQQLQRVPPIETSLQVAPLVELPRPETYAVSFLPLVQGTESMAFVVSPTGQLGTMPMKDIPAAYKTGYRPFTVANLLALTNSILDDVKNTNRKLKELSEDYDALVARYNRLAAINSEPAAHPQTTVQAQPAVDEREAMRLMLFQSLVHGSFPAPTRPYQLPMPANPNANRLQTNCTTTTTGAVTNTNCN